MTDKTENTNQGERLGTIQVFAAGALWGVIGIFVKQLELCGSNVETTSLLRVAFAFVIMAVFCVVRLGFRALLVNGRTLFICALLGIICHGVYNICYSAAVTISGVTISAVLLDIAPVFTLFFSMMFFGERFSLRKLVAIIVNILGCALTVTNGNINLPSGAVLGILCGVGAGLCYSLTAIIGRFATDKTDPFVMSMYSYLFAALFLVVCFRPWSTPLAINSEILIWSFMYALVPTAVAYVLYYKGIAKIKESSKVPLIASVEVVIASILGTLLYNETMGILSALGIVMVVASIAVMNIAPKKHSPQA